MSEVVLGGLTADAGKPRAKRARRLPVPAAAGLAFLLLLVFLAAFGGAVAPHKPGDIDFTRIQAGPSAAHWLGSDQLGRDVLSRLLVGAFPALWGPAVIAIGAMILGNILGLLSGFRGGRTDTVIMRATDAAYAFPGLLIAIVVSGVLGATYAVTVAILVLLFTPEDVRIVRAATLAQRPLPYVEAARTLGLSSTRIMVRHIWPNVLPLAVAQIFLTFARALVALAALAFFGIGVNLTVPTWGLMLADGKSLVLVNPGAALAPAVMIVLTAVSMNVVGDWAYERLTQRGRTH